MHPPLDSRGAHHLDDGPRDGDFAAYVARVTGGSPSAAALAGRAATPTPAAPSADEAPAKPASKAAKPPRKNRPAVPAKNEKAQDEAVKEELAALDAPADDWERRWQAPFAYVIENRWSLVTASFVVYSALVFLLGALYGVLLLFGFELPRSLRSVWGSTLLEWIGIDLGTGLPFAVGLLLILGVTCALWVIRELLDIAGRAPNGIDRKHFVWVVVGLALVEWMVLRRPGGWGLLFLLLLLTGGASRWLWRIVVLLRRLSRAAA
jgi:hypothetical protein